MRRQNTGGDQQMQARTKTSERRRITSGGNMFAELAFVLLPFFALITAFFDVSFALFGWSTIQNAVREGCRYAITYQTALPSNIAGNGTPTCGSSSQDACIKQVVGFYSMNLVPPSSALININYFKIDNSTTPQKITAVSGNLSNAPGNIVEVSIQGYPLNWMIPLSGTGGGGMLNSSASPYRPTTPGTISVYSSDIMGGYPAGTNPTIGITR